MIQRRLLYIFAIFTLLAVQGSVAWPSDPPSPQATLKSACDKKENPLNSGLQPIKQAAGDISPQCSETKTSAIKNTCAPTYMQVYDSDREGKASIGDKVPGVCNSINTEPGKCSGDQKETQKCIARIHQDAAKNFNGIAADLDKKASELNAKAADPDKKRQKEEGRAQAKLKKKNAAMEASAISEGTSGSAEEQHKKLIKDFVAECKGRAMAGPDCEQSAAIAEAKFFAAKLSEAGKKYHVFAKISEKLGTEAETSAGNMGPAAASEDEKKSPIGMDDMLKVATIGMMGAGIYCSATGKCSKSPTSPAAISDPALTGATSPTPIGTPAAAAPENSSTANNTAGSGSSAAPPKPDSGPSIPSVGSSGGTGGQGAFSMAPSDHGISPFSGALDHRTPASTAPSGGSGGGGIGGQASMPNENAAAELVKNGDAGAQNSALGGGFPSAGSFSLGDTHSASPTDAALKNILNGEAPPDSTAVPDDTSGANSNVQASDEPSLNDAQSLFNRVRDTHMRCLKRACVIRVTGIKI